MLGENIKTYRQKKGYTQEEVANRLHVTRQTISKWEKNYSVPDAEVFVKLADVLEVQTSQLLEVKVDSDVQTTEEKQNAYAEQLAHIAEQMAVKNRQSKRIWKTIGIAFAVIIAVCIILIVMNIASFSVYPTTEDVRTHEETIMLEQQSYKFPFIGKSQRTKNRELKERAIIFRCQKCKKWLKNITTETDVVYDGTIYHATNVPAKICPECGKITIYEIIQERIVQYATQRNVKNIDYAECENEEASASQLIL